MVLVMNKYMIFIAKNILFLFYFIPFLSLRLFPGQNKLAFYMVSSPQFFIAVIVFIQILIIYIF
jgi:hypothetical protein